MAALEGRASSFGSAKESHAAAVAGQRAALAALENRLTGLPGKAAALGREREAAAAAFQKKQQELARGQHDMRHQLDDLTKGVLMYKCLGLEFQRANNDQLQIRFTHVDPKDWEKEFVFRVR